MCHAFAIIVIMVEPQVQTKHVSTIQFVAICQEIYLTSSPRRLSIHFFSKALVGEHRALSFFYCMAMTLTLPRSPDVSCTRIPTRIFFTVEIFSNMRSYTSLIALALVASTFSSALSAPIINQDYLGLLSRWTRF
jgi:vacuolar-type H+-ATPase subunit I/STV1